MIAETKKRTPKMSVRLVQRKRTQEKKALNLADTTRTVKFGSVTIVVSPPTQIEVKRNIKAGQAALLRAKKSFLTPGVKLSISRGVPLFSVDSDNPSLLVRKLNGKNDRGILRNGQFEVCK